jgi:phosphohistidine phosphatase
MTLAPDEIQERERLIVILRHGEAEDASGDKSDAERSLTAEGHAAMKQIARGLERALPRANAIYTSPLLRATQTAAWLARAYRARISVTTTDKLAPGATPSAFRELIDEIGAKRAILVGHEPDLSENLRALVGPVRVQLDKAACYAVRITADGASILEWLLPPRILRKLGELE